MQNKQTKYSTCKVLLNGKTVGFLTKTMEENGLDTLLDMQGYEIIAL